MCVLDDDDLPMDITALPFITDYLYDIKKMNPHVAWDDLMYCCIFAGAYMAKKNNMDRKDYLKILRGIKIIDEDIPDYMVGEA
tara:strand:- start:346 stop:594 length:249 start_codon:yes stop_codon:yes gene_type:complete